MKKTPLTQRAPVIKRDYDVKLSFYSHADDTVPKMSAAFAGTIRINLLRLAIGCSLAATALASTVVSSKLKNKSK